MYVCVCFAITEEEVKSAITSGAGSVSEVTRACRAGGDCGSCHGMIETMLEERNADEESAPLIPASALLRAAG